MTWSAVIVSPSKVWVNHWVIKSSFKNCIHQRILTLSIMKYFETFIILILMSRNHRWCSFSLWLLYAFIFSNLMIFDLNDNVICDNSASIATVAFNFSKIVDWTFADCASTFFKLNVSNGSNSVKSLLNV